MKQSLKLLWQTGILSAVYWGSDFLARAASLPVPGNVLGIIILFGLLATGVVKEEWISRAAGFLLHHMVFFFVPIAVGLMNWGGVFYDYGWVLLAAIVVSTVLSLAVVSLAATALRRGERPCSR